MYRLRLKISHLIEVVMRKRILLMTTKQNIYKMASIPKLIEDVYSKAADFLYLIFEYYYS